MILLVFNYCLYIPVLKVIEFIDLNSLVSNTTNNITDKRCLSLEYSSIISLIDSINSTILPFICMLTIVMFKLRKILQGKCCISKKKREVKENGDYQ